MRLARLSILVMLIGGSDVGLGAEPPISADSARRLLGERGELSDVTVADPFDLSLLTEDRFEFHRVTFEAGVVATSGSVAADLLFRGSTLRAIEAPDIVWLGELTFEESRIETTADFRGAEFRAAVRFHFVEFGDEAWFGGARFASSAEFQQCVWRHGVRYSSATFGDVARFNDSTSEETATFQATVFERDVTFVGFEARRAAFLNTVFKDDAEFRFCRFDEASFGSRKHLTVFHGLADFRGCEMGTAGFDYLETRGVASFVKARFGPGGASFSNAALLGPLTNLDGVESAGPIDLTDAYIPGLRFRWSEIEGAVLASNPSAGSLEELAGRLSKLDRGGEALAIQYDLARLARQQTWEDPSSSFAERAWARFEWMTWGWPTGYGTKLGRIVVIAGALWLVLSLPAVLRRGVVARVPARGRRWTAGGNEKASPSRYSPTYCHDLGPGGSSPLTLRRRFGLACAYTFGLLFKFGGRDAVYVELDHRDERPRFERYFFLVWLVGSILVALMAFTLANSSPVISKIVGDVVL